VVVGEADCVIFKNVDATEEQYPLPGTTRKGLGGTRNRIQERSFERGTKLLQEKGKSVALLTYQSPDDILKLSTSTPAAF